MKEFNINREIEKLKLILDDDSIDKSILSYDYDYEHADDKATKKKIKRKNYLLYVLTMTRGRHEVEIYLEKLLKKFDVDDLDCFCDGDSILCFMFNKVGISLNAFKIIINYGININIVDENNESVLFFCVFWDNASRFEIAGLLIDSGINLNVLNSDNFSILDEIIHHENFFQDEKAKPYIMKLIDHGVKTNHIHQYSKNMLEFIESYRSSKIKPAIKN